MSHLDGNMLAGTFADLFSFDVTTATARCAGCGAVAQLATAMVYVSDAGSVVRCPGCDFVLATVVQSEDRVWFGLRGITAVEVRASDASGKYPIWRIAEATSMEKWSSLSLPSRSSTMLMNRSSRRRPVGGSPNIGPRWVPRMTYSSATYVPRGSRSVTSSSRSGRAV